MDFTNVVWNWLVAVFNILHLDLGSQRWKWSLVYSEMSIIWFYVACIAVQFHKSFHTNHFTLYIHKTSRICSTTKLISEGSDAFTLFQPSEELIYVAALMQAFSAAVAWHDADVGKTLEK